MKTKARSAIRISATDEVRNALEKAKVLYPTLSEPEIFKLGLSKVIRESIDTDYAREGKEIMLMASHSVGEDYLSDPEEDIYTIDMGKKVNFS